jgi:nicotinamidase-related amidase
MLTDVIAKRPGRLPAMVFVAGLALAAGSPGREPAPQDSAKSFVLHLRARVETAPGSGRYHTLTKTATWDAAKTAVVICDMWDKHWCPGATARVAEMAPRMNEVVAAARRRGALIIHCPSDTMGFYKDTPQRKLAQAAPKVEPRVPLERWCRLDPKREAPLPIDDTDGGCESGVKSYKAWARQIEAIHIEPGDAVTDSAEAYYLMQQRGIEYVVVMGVHTNMCVLGRPFSIRQMVAQGKNVVLVRDMTDTMYNPARAPFVSHFTGTDLVVEHIEKFWCPTVTSADVIGGREFRFKDDHRPHLVVIAAEDEYQTERTLPEFALKHLGKHFRVSYVFADAKDKHHLPGLEVLNGADVALLSVRRRPLPKVGLDRIRQFIEAGKPLVALRTSSHAFAAQAGAALPAGVVEWKTFDRDVLGCQYHGHYPSQLKTVVQAVPGAAKHPILAGVTAEPIPVTSSLYKVQPLAKGATVLMTGRAGDDPAEPVAWTYQRPGRGRVFYTSLGHNDDFHQEAFVRLLRNGICWAAGLEVPEDR